MFDFDEDEIDLEALINGIEIDEKNMYISDSDKALWLFSDFFRASSEHYTNMSIKKIHEKIDEIFSLCSELNIENQLEFYCSFTKLCDRLKERNRLSRLSDKTVISLGGKFSAGKSKFINSISGLKNVLPEAQNPTTSIPTYIIHSDKNSIYANSIYDYSRKLKDEELKALTHEFYDVYKIGFSAFVESIMIESSDYKLGSNISLLDTPGYTKYDGEHSGKMSVSDRQRAFEQLKTTDYLIWLVDIDNGALTQDDIDFIDSLGIQTEILIVFNKADKKTSADITKIISEANKTVSQCMVAKCFGITAYSSVQEKEYGNDIIKSFLETAEQSRIRGNDIKQEFISLENKMKRVMTDEMQTSKKITSDVFNVISASKKVLEIRSLTGLWHSQNEYSSKLYYFNYQYDMMCSELNKLIDTFLKKGEHI